MISPEVPLYGRSCSSHSCRSSFTGLPQNVQTPDCIHRVGGAQLFMAPAWTPDQKGVKVQIVDVFALKLATGYEKDPTGRLLLQSEESVGAGRTWSLAKACQLVRNDANPNRWVVLHRHKKAWGLFWAGGGLDQCRDQLSQQCSTGVASAIVPATPEALLRLLIELDATEVVAKNKSTKYQSIERIEGSPAWALGGKAVALAVALTSAFWISLSLLLVLHFSDGQKRLEKQLSDLIELTKQRKP